MVFRRCPAASPVQAIACGKIQFEQKVKITSRFGARLLFVHSLFRYIYKSDKFILRFSHFSNPVFTKTTHHFVTWSHERYVHTAQKSSPIFYVCTFCTNFHFFALPRSKNAIFYHFVPKYFGFPFPTCISEKNVLYCPYIPDPLPEAVQTERKVASP